MRPVIIGAGFAGMYAALSAARLRDIQGTRNGKRRRSIAGTATATENPTAPPTSYCRPRTTCRIRPPICARPWILLSNVAAGAKSVRLT